MSRNLFRLFILNWVFYLVNCGHYVWVIVEKWAKYFITLNIWADGLLQGKVKPLVATW